MNIFTKEEEFKIIELYQNGTNIDDIINIFNADERDIRCILKRKQIDRKYNSFSDELYERLEYLYQSGQTCFNISQILLVAENSVTKMLKKRGVHTRTYSECNRKYDLDEKYFDNIDSPNKAYILGLLYADGCNYLKHYAMTLSLQIDDMDVLEFVKHELKYSGPIRINHLSKKNPQHKDCGVLCINSVHMSQALEKLGVVGAKSLVLTFPEWLDEKFYHHFIRGYFDGDGCVSYDEKRNKCTTKIAGTKEFCDKLSEIFYSFGCKHHIVHPKQCKDHNTFILQTGGNKSSLLLLDYIYNNDAFHMERKYQKYLYCKEKYLTKNNTQAA